MEREGSHELFFYCYNVYNFVVTISFPCFFFLLLLQFLYFLLLSLNKTTLIVTQL